MKRKLNELPFGAAFLHKGELFIKLMDYDPENLDSHQAARYGSGHWFRFPQNPEVEEVELVLPQD